MPHAQFFHTHSKTQKQNHGRLQKNQGLRRAKESVPSLYSRRYSLTTPDFRDAGSEEDGEHETGRRAEWRDERENENF
jgi:hypothetical protein